MSKVSRSVLKNLVKECLVEILAEGLVGANKTIQESKRNTTKKRIVEKKKPDRKKVSKQPEQVPGTIQEMTDDPILQSIFADTAKTTLVEQQRADSRERVVAGDSISRMVDESDPTDLFGEAASKWATLAFSEKKLPGQHK